MLHAATSPPVQDEEVPIEDETTGAGRWTERTGWVVEHGNVRSGLTVHESEQRCTLRVRASLLARLAGDGGEEKRLLGLVPANGACPSF